MAKLLDAVFEGKLEDVKSLVGEGVNINYSDDETGNTALHLACIEGHLDIVKYLISEGAKLNQKNLYDLTPLHEVCINASHSLDLVTFLIFSGVDVNVETDYQETALEFALSAGCLETAKSLILAGANYEKLLNKYHECIDKRISSHGFELADMTDMIKERDSLETLVLVLGYLRTGRPIY